MFGVIYFGVALFCVCVFFFVVFVSVEKTHVSLYSFYSILNLLFVYHRQKMSVTHKIKDAQRNPKQKKFTGHLLFPYYKPKHSKINLKKTPSHTAD